MRNGAHNNDNQPLELQPISIALGMVVNRLERTEDQEKQSDRETDRDRTDEQRAKDHRAYIERHLREIAAFEDRARGKKKRI